MATPVLTKGKTVFSFEETGMDKGFGLNIENGMILKILYKDSPDSGSPEASYQNMIKKLLCGICEGDPLYPPILDHFFQ